MKKALMLILRFLVTAGFFCYIFGYLIDFQDKVTCQDGKIISGRVLKVAKSGIQIECQKKKVWIEQKNIAVDKSGKDKVHYGLVTVCKHLKIQIFFLFCSFLLVNVLVSSVRIKWVLATQDTTISLKKAMQITFIGTFFNNFLPGFTGGDLVKAY